EIDEELARLSDFPIETSRTLFGYLREGGSENFRLAGIAIERLLADDRATLAPAVVMPEHGWHRTIEETGHSRAWVLFYRAWQQSGDMTVADALIDELRKEGFAAEGFFCHSLRLDATRSVLRSRAKENSPDVIITMQSFALGAGRNEESFLDS